MEDFAEKKRAIFDSLLALIREHGFHGASMSELARRAGVAAGTIYHYFPSKEQLISDLYQYNRARIGAVIEQALAAGGSYRDQFFRLWRSLYRFYVEQPDVLVFFEQFINSPFNTGRYPGHFRGPLYDLLERGIHEGVFRAVKPEILLVLVMSGINATTKLHVFAGVHLDEQEIENIADIHWSGISVHATNDNE